MWMFVQAYKSVFIDYVMYKYVSVVVYACKILDSLRMRVHVCACGVCFYVSVRVGVYAPIGEKTCAS